MQQIYAKNIISLLGDKSEEFLGLIRRIVELSANVAPNARAHKDFYDLISEINSYLVSYGFKLVVIIMPVPDGCTIRLAMRETAPTNTIQ